jgi:hypothetical protein
MNINAIAAAAVLAAGTPVVAFAQTTAPVAIVSSTIVPQVADASRFQQGFVSYTFVNMANTPATEVDFALEGNGQTTTLRDVGTFSKGVAIERGLAIAGEARDQQLSVAEVKFADGSVWTNDVVAPQPRRQAAITFTDWSH